MTRWSGFRDLLLLLPDHFLDEGKTGWRNVRSLRYCWYWLWTFLGLATLAGIIARLSPFAASVASSPGLTAAYRTAEFVLFLGCSLTWILLSLLYYRHTIRAALPVEVFYVATFFVCSILFFGQTYYYLYHVNPSLFAYPAATTSVKETLQPADMSAQLAKVDFTLFSAVQTLNGSYTRIKGESAVVSLLAWVQSLYTVILVALLVASYVNQHVARRPRGP